MSLWDAKKDTPLFEDAKDSMGLSKLAYHFLGGLLKHAKAYIGVSASTVNSYKRLIVGAPTSGATWSPVYVTYGGNNRTQMIRVPAGGRFEDRTIDGAANPYLTATAILAAGLDGIENELDPGDPNMGNLYEASEKDLKKRKIEILPGNLLDAVRNLRQDKVLRDAFGKTPDGDYIDYYCDVKEREWKDYHDRVSRLGGREVPVPVLGHSLGDQRIVRAEHMDFAHAGCDRAPCSDSGQGIPFVAEDGLVSVARSRRGIACRNRLKVRSGSTITSRARLSKDTNWWGAFVVGLAGTILVTGVTPAVLAAARRRRHPAVHLLGAVGVAAMPVPRGAGRDAPGPRRRGSRLRVLRVQGPAAEGLPHINGVTVLDVLARLDAGHGRQHDPHGGLRAGAVRVHADQDSGPRRSSSSASTSATSRSSSAPVLSIVLLLISNRGIKFGTAAATVLGILSMVPLTLIAVLPFLTGHVHGSNIWPPNLPDGPRSSAATVLALPCSSPRCSRGTRSRWRRPAATSASARTRDRDAPIAMDLAGATGRSSTRSCRSPCSACSGIKFIQSSLDTNAILVTTRRARSTSQASTRS